MSIFKLIKEIDEEAKAAGTLLENVTVSLNGKNELVVDLLESASHIVAKAIDLLKAGKPVPDEMIGYIAGIRFLANDVNRQTIADTVKGGENTIRTILIKAGEDVDANRSLYNFVKEHGKTVIPEVKAALDAAAKDPKKAQQAIQSLGKMMDIIGRVQTGAAIKHPPKKELDLSK